MPYYKSLCLQCVLDEPFKVYSEGHGYVVIGVVRWVDNPTVTKVIAWVQVRKS